jgi:hypothetical protein
MKILNISKGSFDKINTFRIVTRPGRFPATASLECDYEKRGDGILWALSGGTIMQGHYSSEDRANLDRLNKMSPIENGEIVEINGNQYITRVLGDYSNCAIFDPII